MGRGAMRARHLLLLALVVSSGLCARAQEESEDEVFQDPEPAAEEETSFEPPEPASAPEPAPAPAQEPAPAPVPKPSAAVLTVDSAAADVILASGKRQSKKSADFGGTLLDGVSLDSGTSVEVTFTPKTDGAPSKPQQAMVVLQPKAHKGLAAYAVAKAKKDGSHSVTLSQSLVEKQLGPVGGKLSVTLLLGDPAVPKGVRWDLGTVKLPAVDAAPSPAYRTALIQPISNTLPNIAHIFRPPEKQPALVVSLAFTALALAPLALLALWLLASGSLGMQSFPTGPAALWALLFHGGIASILVLYFLFWARLNLAQTLPAALALGLATAAVGYKALGTVADARLQQERAGATPAKKGN